MKARIEFQRGYDEGWNARNDIALDEIENAKIKMRQDIIDYCSDKGLICFIEGCDCINNKELPNFK